MATAIVTPVQTREQTTRPATSRPAPLRPSFLFVLLRCLSAFAV